MVARESAVGETAAARKSSSTGSAQGSAEETEDAGKPADKRATPAKKTGTAPARKSTDKKAAARKSAAKKSATKKTAAKKTASGGGGAKATKAAAKRAAAPGGKAGKPAGAAPGKKAAAKRAGSEAEDTAQTTGVETVAAKNTPAQAETVPTARTDKGDAARPEELLVRPGEEPWTPGEVEEARDELKSEAERLHAEIVASEEALTGLMRDSGDGAGDDDADTGSKNITREHEMALAHNAREMLYQTERALERLDANTYGRCENCGMAIGKARMQAFPRATLCVECKQKQERR
ncbi:DNA-binding protein [Streptomyces sp. AJS327]|uniref:TraR/DksA family transcriptional regulator n=1 Tax=Streptomyces sp. AJS327 TaxID=2545265 RepID=UPI0015DE5C81|nr:TraR/DksA C4-type zinc finger protein [Streptomyces sp. AJS327]MBA0050341.1 DNA-binding protein [Streptomyces sp. AJS327]